jgi:hypothetical protein
MSDRKSGPFAADNRRNFDDQRYAMGIKLAENAAHGSKS